jgi:diguanylate cyclase (GGDEF)-like protein/PAS domain S-box-containing protein
MNWPQIVFPLALLTAAIASTFAAVTAWRKKPAPGAIPLALLLMTVSAWSMISAQAGLATSASQFNLLITLTVICQVSTATLLLTFVLEYTRQDYFLARGRIALLWLIPLLIAIMALGNDSHQTFWLSPQPATESTRNILLPGIFYGTYLAYIYLIRFVATLILVMAIVRYPANHRAHANYLLAAAIVSWLAVVVKLPNLDNLPLVWAESLQPIAYALSGIIIAWGIFRHQLIDLVPIIRDTLLDNLLDGIIVLDNQHRLVDINRAARYLLQLDNEKQIIGTQFEQILNHLPEIKQVFTASDMPYQDIYLPPPADLSLEVMSIPISDRQGQLRGTMFVLHDISSRTRSEAAMRQSEENLRNVFENAPFPIIVTSEEEGYLLYVNPAALRLYNLEESNLKELRNLYFYQNPEKRQEIRALLKEQGKIDYLELPLKTSDKQPLWVATSIRKIIYNAEKALLVSQVDISQQRRNLEELRQSRAQLKNIFEHADAGIYLLDPSEGITFSNERWAELLGESAENLIGKNLSEYIFKSDIPYSRYLFESLIAGEIEKFSLELRYRRANGSLFWGTLSAIPIFDSKDEITSIVVFASDITQKKETENALKESERRFREILEKIYLFAVMLDTQGNIIFCNEYFLNKTGWQAREILGQNWFNIFQAQNAGQTQDEYKRAIQRETIVSRHENEILTSEGNPLLIAWSNILLRDANGKVTGSASIGEDITERRQAQQAEREQRLFAEALYDTAAAITSTLEFDEVMDRILENLDAAVETTSANISLLEHGKIRFVRAKGYENYGITNDDILQLKFSFKNLKNMRIMHESKKPICIPDTEKYPDWSKTETSAFIKSYIGAPIVVKDKVVGFISIDSNIPGFFNDFHAERLRAFSLQAAIAIENTRLYTSSLHELEERKRAQASLKRANKKLQSQLEKIETLQAQLREQAIRDALTGMFNRRYLEEILPEKIKQCQARGLPLSLMMVDIDHFKVVNDNYGHQAGDEILQYLGELFQQKIGEKGIACRYGGEEFAIVLPEVDINESRQYAEAIRLAFKQHRHKSAKGSIQSTVSIGISCFPVHGQDGHGLLTAADNALYRAKYAGRNCIKIAE